MDNRGIGNVIATGVMIFLMIFTVGQLYVHSINLLDDYNRVAEKMLASDLQSQNERIAISNLNMNLSGATIKLNLTITNAGGESAHIVSVWLNNGDVSTAPHKRVSMNEFIGPGLSKILAGLDTDISTSGDIPVIIAKVFTELGNRASVQLIPAVRAAATTETSLSTQLLVLPPNPVTGNRIVVQLIVVNDNPRGVGLFKLTPDLKIVQGTTPETGVGCTLVSQPVRCNLVASPLPSEIGFLQVGTTLISQWTYEVNSNASDAQITFTASYVPLTTQGLLASQKPSKSITVRGFGGVEGSGVRVSSFSTGETSFDSSFGLAKNIVGDKPLRQNQDIWSQMCTPSGSTVTLWLTVSSRIVLKDTSSGKLFAGALSEWAKGSGMAPGKPDGGPVDKDKDTTGIDPGECIKLKFLAPSQGAGIGQKFPAGTYGVTIFLFGFDNLGRIYAQKFEIGTLTVGN